MPHFKYFRLTFAFLLAIISAAACAQNTSLNKLPAVNAFIDKMVRVHGFERQGLERLFSRVKIQPKIISTMQAPHEAKPWFIYRSTFLKPERVKAGVEFWRKNANILSTVEKEYGVPASVIVGILGVETYYGRIKGSHRVIDALSTLAFYYPKRASFFASELEQFLLLAREQRWDPLLVLGSYAGAMGKPQFMPSSYRQYAVSYYKDGHIDLMDRDGDVIASVANYFRQHNWRSNEKVIVVRQSGPFESIPTSGPLAFKFIKLEGKDGPEYWLGEPNFYVLSRYNPRVNYTMAVYQLSEEIRKLY